MSAPEEWDDIRNLEAADRRQDRRDRIRAALLLLLVAALVFAACAWGFGGWRS